MEVWQDHGIVLSVRRHGENGAVVSLLTHGRGRHAGYVRGVHSPKMRGVIQPGNLVDARWQSRLAHELGTFMLEPRAGGGNAAIMTNSLRLAALQSACALCDAGLPEREGHEGLFKGLLTLIEMLEGSLWAQAYIVWEIAFLKELGFSLDLSRCAAGGDDRDLMYVSPKTGRAVSKGAGELYKERLLPLPDFLKPGGGPAGDETGDIRSGLQLTGYFLERWAFAHHSDGVPEARTILQARMKKSFAADPPA